MILSIIFAHVWGVFQLLVLGSFARTIRIRTLLIAIAAGLYGCAVATVILQVAWTRPMAWLTQTSLSQIVGMASYTVDPFIEEIMKVMPLVLLLRIPTIRRQWSYTDCILIGAALGSGFGLAEALFRFGTIPSRVSAEPFGWMIHKLLSTIIVFGPSTVLTSWLPDYVSVGDLFSSQAPAPGLNRHLVWSAVAGLAVGLYFLKGDRVGRRAGIALLMYVSLDHASHNFDVSGASGMVGILAPPFRVLRHGLGFFPIMALIIAWYFDRQRLQRGPKGDLEPSLIAERTQRPHWKGTLVAALSQLPWTAVVVFRFVRVRRAYNRGSYSREETSLTSIVQEFRNQIDRVTTGATRLSLPATFRLRTFLKILRQPVIVLWIVLMIPSILWFIVGAYPQMAWLQLFLASKPAWIITLLLSLLALAWMAWLMVIGRRKWGQAVAAPLGDESAGLSLRLLSGSGALGLGLYSMLLAISGSSPHDRLVSDLHVLNAIALAELVMTLLAALAALIIFAPEILAMAGIGAEVAGVMALGEGALAAGAGGAAGAAGWAAALEAAAEALLAVIEIIQGLIALGNVLPKPQAGPKDAKSEQKSPEESVDQGDIDDTGTPTRVTNPKHHPNSASPEPDNVDELFDNSVADEEGVRWAKDSDGTIHRFSKPSNGESHWNGSTKGSDPIQPRDIPVKIKRLFGYKG